MIAVRRLLAVGGILSLTAALTCAHVWGEPAGKDRVPPEYNINTTLTFEVKPGHNTADWPLVTKKK